MALRLDPTGGRNDLEDILNLMQVVGMKDRADILEFAARFYPEARASVKLVLPSSIYGMTTPTGWKSLTMNRPDTLAEVAYRISAGAAFGPTLSEFLDEFYRNADRRAAMIADEPARLGDPREHAILGAVGEHLARRWSLAVPTWTDHPSRFLHEPYFTTPIENLKAMLLAQSPLAFRRRLIFTEAEPLRRARMPRAPAP
jgi:hypothetical protein